MLTCYAVAFEIICRNRCAVSGKGVSLFPHYHSFRHESFFRFYNGGLLFSAVTFVFIAIISLYSFLLLLDAKMAVPGSFGGIIRISDYPKPFLTCSSLDIGGTLYGPTMRYIILGSIVVSQMGFVAAYTIFVSQNLQVDFLSLVVIA